MHFGVSMFHTDYSIPAVELARALEARGFESMWAPEHSHIPVPRKTPFPGGGELPKPYYEVMDPFVVLSAAAGVTKTLKLATGVLPRRAARPDPDGKARRLDRSGVGRTVSIRRRRRLEPRGDRGPWYRLRDPLQADARAHRGDEGDLDRGEAGISWRVREFSADDDLAQAGAEAISADHRRRRISAWRAPRYGDGWVPIAGRGPYGDVNDYLPKFKQMVREAGRDPAALPITLFGGTEDLDLLKRYRDMGVARVVTTLPPEPADKTLPALDRWAELIRRVNS
jgi:hypothetical protein